MQGRKKGRKRIIKLIKNQQQLAQDKLYEISCQDQDKFVDESQMLSIEHKKEDDQPIQKASYSSSILNIIDRLRRTQNRIKTETKKKVLSIQNKLQSKQVFIGVKPTFDNKQKESYTLFRQKQRAKSTSIFSKYFSKQMPIRQSSTQLSQKLHSNTLVLKTSDIQLKNSIHFIKRKDMSRQSHKLQNIRNRTNADLLFNPNDRNRVLSNLTRFI